MKKMKTKTMKKKTLLLGVLTATAALFAACNNHDDAGMEPATLSTLGEPVKAQFTISIPMEYNGVTRMTAATVQNAEDISSFRGIDFIKLYPSAIVSGSLNSTSALGAPIGLTQMLKPNQTTVSQYIPNAQLLAASNSVLYGDVIIPTNTRTFLFYGKAIDNTANTAITTASDCFKFGILQTSGLTDNAANASGFTFTPVSITTATTSDTKRSAILTYINSIVAATEDSSDPDKAWSATNNAVLRGLYNNFVSMKAGSSKNLEAAVEDLYNALVNNNHTLAQAICSAINNSTYVAIALVSGSTNTYTVTFNSNIAGYPSTSDNLPDGAAVLSFSNGSYSYAESSASSTTLNVASITNYAYPANLYYWVKSDIKTATTSQAANYTSTMTWDNNATTGIFPHYNQSPDNTVITADTRSVLLTQPVQYGVGRLDIKVAASNTVLADNGAGTSDGEKNVSISNIKLTGVLIGSQKNVGWNFQPLSTGTDYTMYDNICVSQNNATGLEITNSDFSSIGWMNHTLVLETPGPADEYVNVALEFVNNGPDFWGKDGIVPTGTHFYLVGKLDIADSHTSDASNTGNKVFKQDYKTLALFTIKNLKKAENTIPDLRNAAIELGLSVNLSWQTGATFSLDIE